MDKERSGMSILTSSAYFLERALRLQHWKAKPRWNLVSKSCVVRRWSRASELPAMKASRVSRTWYWKEKCHTRREFWKSSKVLPENSVKNWSVHVSEETIWTWGKMPMKRLKITLSSKDKQCLPRIGNRNYSHQPLKPHFSWALSRLNKGLSSL